MLGALAGCGSSAAPARCAADDECPLHQLCVASGACVTGCESDDDCHGGACDAHGRCSPAPPDLAPARDAGAHDLATSSSPDLSMVMAQVCGDGVLAPGEQCDDGAANSDVPSVNARCTSQCRVRASCGALAGSTAAAIDPATGRCYVAWPGPVAWQSAQRACRAQGGALAAIGSSAEDQLVRGLITQPSWIGLYAPAGTQQFATWVTGEAVAFTAFATGQPSNGAMKECMVTTASGWENDACGWPTSGNLPQSPAHTLAYVCESACGNGAVDPGEECDPPGATCTAACMNVRACTEPGAASSPVNGHCYFVTGAAAPWATAMNACPAATHVATLAAPEETEAALAATGGQAWIALTGMPGTFAWGDGEDFNARRYHGFISGEPNHGGPACVRLQPGGWADQACSMAFATLCERE
jgi:hypothetical protein